MMKQYRPVITVFAVIAVLGFSVAYQARAAGPKFLDGGNKHNLSASNTGVRYQATNDLVGNPRGQEICIFCHTPHNANIEGGAPLWNRNFSTAAFQRYSSNTLQIRVDPTAKSSAGYEALAWQPDGSSKLCLSCHDGVSNLGDVLRGGPIAMTTTNNAGDVISSDTAISWASFKPADKMKIGHHPVSFTFDAAVRDNINAKRLASSKVQLPDFLPQVKLPNHKMQCTTCHDAHQNQSNDNDFYPSPNDTRKIAPFWVYGVNNNGSADQQAVCTACHPMDTFTTPWP